MADNLKRIEKLDILLGNDHFNKDVDRIVAKSKLKDEANFELDGSLTGLFTELMSRLDALETDIIRIENDLRDQKRHAQALCDNLIFEISDYKNLINSDDVKVTKDDVVFFLTYIESTIDTWSQTLNN